MMADSMAQARFNMVEQQIRPWEVLDPKVLNLLETLAREEFVPESYRHLAYADIEIPLGLGQCMMFPRIEAKILQSLAVKRSDKVLEIGTGSGYLTACLARLADQVVSVDIHQEFTDQARSTLDRLGVRNVSLLTGDAMTGASMVEEPYDAIAVTGSLESESQLDLFRRQLKPNGRLAVIVGRPPIMQFHLITRVGEKSFRDEVLLETVVAPLEHAHQPALFRF